MRLADRIKFDTNADDLLVWKYPREDIRIGSQLVVNQSQEALFVKSGAACDLFGPGTHTLTTGNLPLLQKLVDLPFEGQTPFTAEIWYINRTVKRDLKWGTKSPIPLIDPAYSIPVKVRAYGRWGIVIADSRLFITWLVGTQSGALADKIEDYFEGELLQRLSDRLSEYIAEKKVSVFQANSKLNELSETIAEDISPEFARFGVGIVNFNTQNISIPDSDFAQIQEVLRKRMEIDQISQSKMGQPYITMRTFDTLEKAADNESGAAGGLLAGGLGLGMGLGAGVPVGQSIGSSMSPSLEGNSNAKEQSGIRPVQERLQLLRKLLEDGLISQEEFDAKRKDILNGI